MVRVAKLGNYATSVDDLIDKVFPNFQENVWTVIGYPNEEF